MPARTKTKENKEIFRLFQVVPMTMTSNEKRMLEREALRSVIQQWNANRLDLFELSEPDEVRVYNQIIKSKLLFFFSFISLR